jgi:hypothetical protein
MANDVRARRAIRPDKRKSTDEFSPFGLGFRSFWSLAPPYGQRPNVNPLTILLYEWV